MEHPENPKRKPNRWIEYNYSHPGGYFFTVCTFMRKKILARVVGNLLVPTESGSFVMQVWARLPEIYLRVRLDRFAILPDHVHGILFLSGDNGVSLAQVLRTFKSLSGAAINRLRKITGSPVWQRSYFDRVLRDEAELILAREYIDQNPAHWIHRHSPEFRP